MSVNFECVCRLCLSSRGELSPIFPTTSADESGPAVLATKIKDCVSVNINENDELPTNVCKKCLDNVNNWHTFKEICEKAQNKLLSLKNDVSLLEEVKVKDELCEEGYDDAVVIDGSYPEFEQNVTDSNKLQPEGPPILASLGLTPRSDKNYVDPRLDWQRVHAILDMVQEDEVIDSLQNTEECDAIQHSDHDSDTEAEVLSDIDRDYVECKDGYLSRDKRKFSKSKHSDSTLTNKPKINVMKRKMNMKYCSTPKDAWQLFFSEDLLELIVDATNENIRSNSNQCSTSVKELKALIGILYYHGIVRSVHHHRNELWDDRVGPAAIKNAMGHDRFEFLLKNLRFEKRQFDNLLDYDIMKQMRKVFEIFAHNCRTAFDIENVVVIDEIIVPVYGPCPFKYNIQRKNLCSGFKMVALVDPSNFYVSNLDIVTDSYHLPEEIVKKLVHHLTGSGRTVVMDSWYTSLAVTQKLLDDYRLYTIGALNPRDDLLPPLFLSRHRPKGTHMTAFVTNTTTLASFVNNRGKVVNVLTNHPRYYKRAHSKHASVISSYKKNQPAVEVLDVLSHYYTTMQYSNNWTLSLFFTLLNVAAINSQVVWCYQKLGTTVHRRYFIRSLALNLMQNNELKQSNVKKPVLNLSIVENVSEDGRAFYLDPIFRHRRQRCRVCVKTTKKDRKTRVHCYKCGQAICREHQSHICVMCTDTF